MKINKSLEGVTVEVTLPDRWSDRMSKAHKVTLLLNLDVFLANIINNGTRDDDSVRSLIPEETPAGKEILEKIFDQYQSIFAI